MTRYLFLLLALLLAAGCTPPETAQTPSPTPAKVASDALLLDWVAEGGNTPRGLGRQQVKIWRNGKIGYYDAYKDERIPMPGQTATPGPDAADGWTYDTLTQEETDTLAQAVGRADFDSLSLDPNATRPSAYDSQDETITFTTASGEVEVKLWQLKEPDQLEAVTLFKAMLEKHRRP
ncbi:MAG: hypothetical protein KC910_12400 [Candidatus Eremiobacteraeota bacterium]|nr:hypothetical protein [Candidatus Eremiobacteraeota bacterium]